VDKNFLRVKTKSILPVFLILFTAVGSASSITWNTSSDWDNAVSETGVVHEEVQNTDLNDARELRKGYSAENPLYSSNLVGYWRLDEDSGDTAYDFSGNNNDGSTSGGTIQREDGLLGTDSYGFDGEDDTVVIPNSQDFSFGRSEFSVFAWVKPDPKSNSRVIGHGDDGSGNDLWEIVINRNGNDFLEAYVRDESGDNGPGWFGDTTIQSGEWSLVGLIRTSSTSKLVLNDQVVSTADASGIDQINPEDSLVMGEVFGLHYKGEMDEVRIYDKALSSSEIQKLYNQAPEESSLKTTSKTFSEEKTASKLKLENIESTLNGKSATVYVESDTDGDDSIEETSDPVTLNGSGGPYNVSGLSSESKNFRLDIRMSTSDVTTTPKVSSLNLTAGAGRPAICDTIGPQNECISENTHDVDGQNINLDSKFEAKETATFEAFTTQAQLSITNSSVFSGLWTGTFNSTADQITIKPGADFRPENGRIILRNFN
jgi:hypothetical protein